MRKNKTSSVLILASIFIVIAGIMYASNIVLPILLALFISIISTQPILWLSKKKVPYALSVFLVLTGIALIFFIMGGLIGGSLAQFSADAPKYEANLKEMAGGMIKQLEALGLEISADKMIQMFDPGKLLNFTAGAVGEIGNIMSDSFLILLIVIFILLELQSFVLKAEVVQITQGKSLKYLNKIGQSIRQYLSIKTIVSLLTGVLITVWLWIIGVDYAILWGLIAFLLNYIPNIGSIIAAVPTMLLALVQLGPISMLWTGVGYLAVNMIVGNIIEPKVMGKGLGLSTLVVFLSLIVWGFIFGAVGMFLSVPLTMSIKIMLEENNNTKWVAVLLGTEEDTSKILDQYKEQTKNAKDSSTDG